MILIFETGVAVARYVEFEYSGFAPKSRIQDCGQPRESCGYSTMDECGADIWKKIIDMIVDGI